MAATNENTSLWEQKNKLVHYWIQSRSCMYVKIYIIIIIIIIYTCIYIYIYILYIYIIYIMPQKGCSDYV